MTKITASKPAKAAAPKAGALITGIIAGRDAPITEAARIDMNDPGFRFERIEAEDLKAQ